MRRRTAIVFLTLIFLVPTLSMATELDGFLDEVNVSARADPGGFRANLSVTFGVSSRDVDGLFAIFDRPADVYITLRIGEVADVAIDRVVEQYRANKGQGWGVIAKNLGIKPGSPEFHALKQGRLAGHGHDASSAKPAADKGKGRSGAHR